MSPPSARPDRLAKQLVDACREMLRRKPWDVLAPDAFFLMAVPTEEHPLAVAITGRDGVELGLTLSRGADGLVRAVRAVYSDGPGGHSPPAVRERWDHIGLGFEPLSRIPTAFRGLLERGGLTGRRELMAPLIYCKRPGEDVRSPSRHELRTLLWCLGAVFAAMDTEALRPTPLARGRMLQRVDVTGSLSRPEVQVRDISWAEALGSADQMNDVWLPGDPTHTTPAELEQLPVEDPQTLEEWKQAERHFAALMSARIQEGPGGMTARSFRRYFGDDETGTGVFNELENLCPQVAFIEWLAADYRATSRSKTWLQKLLLRKDTAPVHRALAQARCDAEHSIYRVESTDPGASFQVEDILSGRRASVSDALLSGSVHAGLFIPLRLMQIGEWVFPLIAGPALTAFQIGRAMRHLDTLGLPPGVTGLRPIADIMGDLWAWALYARDEMPQLQNTDGDPLLWYTTSYQVARLDALLAALDARDDLVCDQPGCKWTWLREGAGVAGIGDSISLCHLELLGNELLVEANSARRMASARAWVDALPGVSLLSQSSDPVDGRGGSRPLDDRLPGAPMDPALLAEVRRLMDARHRAWLDESLPALGGQTPRQAAADPRTRAAVARLIRTMPSTGSPGGQIEPPRQELLDELGLGD